MPSAVGGGVAEHSYLRAALDRCGHADVRYCVTFGTPEEMERAAMVNAAHRKVTGAGYRASDPQLQLWVEPRCTTRRAGVRGAVRPAPRCHADRSTSSTRAGDGTQVPAELWPADRAAFRLYWEGMLDTLEVTDDARRVARDLLSASQAPLIIKVAMPLNRFLTAAWLPERIRDQYGIAWDEGQQRRYDQLMMLTRPAYRPCPYPAGSPEDY